MTTGQDYANFTTSRLATRQDLKERLLEHLRQSDREVTQKVYPDGAVFFADMQLLSGSVNDSFTIGPQPTPPEVTDGVGNIIDLSEQLDDDEVDIPFENSNATTYWVALKAVERPQDIVVNPRTGQPEYNRIVEDVGVAAAPNSVTDNGNGTITFNVNSVAEASHSHAGRLVAVYLNVPEATNAADAIEVVAVAYGAPNNTITTTGTLGQSVVSTTASDYTVVMLGPVVRKTDISADLEQCFVGTIAGNGPAAIPTSFDITGQTRIDATLTNLNSVLDNFTKEVNATGGGVKSTTGYTKRLQSATAVHNGQMYVMGGFETDGATYSTANEAYNPLTDTWTSKAAIPASSADATFVGRTYARAETVGDHIYLIGGLGTPGNVEKDVIQAYNANTNTWEGTDRTPMTTDRQGHASGVINGLIYISHGRSQAFDALQSAEVYDPVLNTSTVLTSSAQPRQDVQHQCCVIQGNNRLYVFGGRDQVPTTLNSLESYDPSLDQWFTHADLETDPAMLPGTPVAIPMYSGVMEAINDVIHVAFGLWNGSKRPWHMMYNYKKDEWRPFAWRHRPYSPYNYNELVADLLNIPCEPREQASSAVIDGIMYVVGGFPTIVSLGDFATDVMVAFDGNGLEIAENAGVVSSMGRVGPADGDQFVITWSTLSKTLPSEVYGTGVQGHQAVNVHGVIYLIGGEDNIVGPEDHLISYHPETGTYTLLASMPAARYDFGVHVDQSNLHIYVVGGYDGVASLDNIIRYSIAGNNWSTIMSGIPNPRSRAMVAGYGNLIYEFGGDDPFPFATNACRVHDTGMRATTNLASMSSDMLGSAGVVVPDRGDVRRDDYDAYTSEGNYKVYYTGGSRAGLVTDDISFYDPILDQHFDRPTGIGQAHTRHKVILHEGELFGGTSTRIRVIGGIDNGGLDLPDNYNYEPLDGSFGSLGAPLPTGVHDAAVCLWEGAIFVFGGRLQAGTKTNVVQKLGYFAEHRKNQPINYSTYHQADTFGVAADDLFGWGSWFDPDVLDYVKQGEE